MRLAWRGKNSGEVINRAITVRIVGGLGNQLFCYAFAKALAIKSRRQLVLDIYSGFNQDKFQRKYSLGTFNISSAKTTFAFKGIMGRICQVLLRRINRWLPYGLRFYFFEGDWKGREISPSWFHPNVYLDGYWQSPKHFSNCREKIRADLNFQGISFSTHVLKIKQQIENSNAVCVHVRQLRAFSQLGERVADDDGRTLHVGYYQLAVARLMQHISQPTFFLFGDQPDWLRKRLNVDNTVVVDTGNEISDFMLMSACKHFIISNSTFAWWGAWLSQADSKIVIAPAERFWDNDDILDDGWVTVEG